MDTIWVSGNLEQNAKFLDKKLHTSCFASASGALILLLQEALQPGFMIFLSPC